MQVEHVTLHGHDFSYRIAGRGPAIVLIHGLASSSETWSEVIPALAGRYTVVAPDLLGHGQSAKPAGDYSIGAHASALRDLVVGALGIERATLVGQSLGGGVAMQLAYQNPELCERLVLAASGGLGREVSWLLRLLSLPATEYAMSLFFPRFVRDRGNRLHELLASRGIHAPVVAEAWRAYASLGDPDARRAFMRTVRSVIEPGGQAVSATNRLYLAAAAPTLVVWGDRDEVIPVEHAHRAHQCMPGSRLEIFEGAGHLLHLEQPARFARLLDEFVRETEPAEADMDAYRELLRSGAGIADLSADPQAHPH